MNRRVIVIKKKVKPLHGCIYLLRNLANGKGYVGQDQSGDPENHRWKQHIKASLTGKSKYALHHAIYKAYHESKSQTLGFSAEVIWRGPIEKLNEKEISYIKKLHTYVRDPAGHGYNLTIGGDGAAGHRHTKKTRRQMSNSLLLHWTTPSARKSHLAAIQSVESRAATSAAQRRRFAEMSKKERIEYSALCSKTQKRRYKDPAAHKAARKGQRNRFKDPEKRAANAKAHRTKEFRTRQADDSSAKWKDTKWRKKWLKSARSPEGHRTRSSAAKRWHTDPEKHARQQAAANQAPKAQKKRSKTLVAWYADPKNHAKHLKTHRTKEFRAKRSKIAKAQWPKTPEERKAYWRRTHPNGNGHGQLTK